MLKTCKTKSMVCAHTHQPPLLDTDQGSIQLFNLLDAAQKGEEKELCFIQGIV